MDWPELLNRIQSGESDTTEFKRWDGFPGRVGDAVCAFSNTEGGVIILGVSDSGQILGVPEDPERVQERLTSFLGTGLSTPVRATLGRHRSEERRVGKECRL